MRNELSLLRNMWPTVFLGTALVSGCESAEAAPMGPPSTGVPETVKGAVEEDRLRGLAVSSPVPSYFLQGR